MIDYTPIHAQGKREAFSASHEGGQAQGPERFTSAYRRQDGQDVPLVSGDSRHHRRATGGVRSLAPVRPNSEPGSGRS
jgi:hypothetical protein